MGMYIYLLIVAILISFVHDYCKQRLIKEFSLLFLFSILFIIPALRDYSVGTDSEMYANFLTWSYSIKDWMTFGIEPANALVLDKISYLGWSGYWLYFLIYSLITNFFFVLAIKRIDKKSILFPVILFLCYNGLYFIQLNNMRQITAVAIFSFSLFYLIKKENKKFVIGITLACMFHYSAAICLILIFCNKLMHDHFKKLVSFTVLFIFLISIISSKLYMVAALIPGLEKFLRYSQSNTDSNGSKIFLFSILLFLPTLPFIKIKSLKTNPALLLGLYLTVVTLTLQFSIAFLGLDAAGLGRMYQYFIFGCIIYYALIAKQMSASLRLTYYITYTIAMCAYMYIYMNIYGLGGYVPYKINELLF